MVGADLAGDTEEPKGTDTPEGSNWEYGKRVRVC